MENLASDYEQSSSTFQSTRQKSSVKPYTDRMVAGLTDVNNIAENKGLATAEAAKLYVKSLIALELANNDLTTIGENKSRFCYNYFNQQSLLTSAYSGHFGALRHMAWAVGALVDRFKEFGFAGLHYNYRLFDGLYSEPKAYHFYEDVWRKYDTNWNSTVTSVAPVANWFYEVIKDHYKELSLFGGASSEKWFEQVQVQIKKGKTKQVHTKQQVKSGGWVNYTHQLMYGDDDAIIAVYKPSKYQRHMGAEKLATFDIASKSIVGYGHGGNLVSRSSSTSLIPGNIANLVPKTVFGSRDITVDAGDLKPRMAGLAKDNLSSDAADHIKRKTTRILVSKDPGSDSSRATIEYEDLEFNHKLMMNLLAGGVGLDVVSRAIPVKVLERGSMLVEMSFRCQNYDGFIEPYLGYSDNDIPLGSKSEFDDYMEKIYNFGVAKKKVSYDAQVARGSYSKGDAYFVLEQDLIEDMLVHNFNEEGVKVFGAESVLSSEDLFRVLAFQYLTKGGPKQATEEIFFKPDFSTGKLNPMLSGSVKPGKTNKFYQYKQRSTRLTPSQMQGILNAVPLGRLQNVFVAFDTEQRKKYQDIPARLQEMKSYCATQRTIADIFTHFWSDSPCNHVYRRPFDGAYSEINLSRRQGSAVLQKWIYEFTQADYGVWGDMLKRVYPNIG